MKSANMSVEQTRLKSQFGTFVRIQRSEDWIQVSPPFCTMSMCI